MGLDQYAYTKDAQDEQQDIAYWRKHPNLQGWMEELYRQKGGKDEFNCVEVELALEDLERLESDILSSALPNTTGFFFGSDSDDYYKEKDLEFINKSRDLINNGEPVYYSSWW
tara:strand:+ start:2661 stop:2999 length:339 start_codon:yes stop_codon:yes gene_type:complete